MPDNYTTKDFSPVDVVPPSIPGWYVSLPSVGYALALRTSPSDIASFNWWYFDGIKWKSPKGHIAEFQRRAWFGLAKEPKK